MSAHAQSSPWPSRDVRVILPVSAGGANDALARAVFDHVGKQLGTPFVIVNQAGGGAVLGTSLLAQISHFYMTAAEYARKTGAKVDAMDDVYVEHRPTMRAWPYDMQGRMKGETLYYAQTATYSRLDPKHALTPDGVKAALAPLIDDAWRDFLANPAPDTANQTH